MATTQKSLPFGTTNTTDDVIEVIALANVGGAGGAVHVFKIPFEEKPQVLSGVSEGIADLNVTALATATQVTITTFGTGTEDAIVMLRGKLKSTSDKLP